MKTISKPKRILEFLRLREQDRGTIVLDFTSPRATTFTIVVEDRSHDCTVDTIAAISPAGPSMLASAAVAGALPPFVFNAPLQRLMDTRAHNLVAAAGSQVRVAATGGATKLSLRVFDAQGRLVHQADNAASSLPLRTQFFSPLTLQYSLVFREAYVNSFTGTGKDRK